MFFSSEGDLSIKIKGKSTSPLFCGLKWKLKSRGILIYEIKKNYSKQSIFSPNLDSFQWLFIKFLRCRDKGIEYSYKYLKPVKLFFIDYDYCQNKAANKLNIELYYIQHGVINCNHHIWRKSVKDDTFFSILLWDKQSREIFESNKNIKTYVVGNLWFKYLMSDENDSFINYINSQYSLNIGNKSPTILVTLTYNNPEFNFLTEDLEHFISETVDKYQWLIRLHPLTFKNKSELKKFKSYLNEKFNFQILKKINWFDATCFPLPIILKYVDFHITIESSVILDAELMNIPSLLLNKKVLQFSPEGKSIPPYGGPEYFKNQLNKGILKVLSIDYNSISHWLNSVQKGDKKTIDNNMEDDLINLINHVV